MLRAMAEATTAKMMTNKERISFVFIVVKPIFEESVLFVYQSKSTDCIVLMIKGQENIK